MPSASGLIKHRARTASSNKLPEKCAPVIACRAHPTAPEKSPKKSVNYLKNTVHAYAAFNCIYFCARLMSARASPGAV